MNHPELVQARRDIALGKIDAFAFEAHRLACLVGRGTLTIADVVDTLREADVSNGLSEMFGADLMQSIMNDAFAAGVYSVDWAEVAA
jgi:hypothetical protein